MRIQNKSLFKLISSVLVIFYIFFLLIAALKIIMPQYNLSLNFPNLLNLTILTVLYILGIYFVIPKNLDYALNFQRDMLYFFTYSLLFVFASGCLIKIILMIKNVPLFIFILNMLLLISFMIIIAYKILILILKIFIFNLQKNISADNQKKIYIIHEFNEFVKNSTAIINQSNRLSIKTGIILIYLSNFNSMKKKFSIEELKFIRKQILFILSENSRIYEPWGRTEDKSIYLKIIQYKDDFDFQLTTERFFKLINEHVFKLYNKTVKINFRILGYKIKMQTIEKNYQNNIAFILDELIKNIKTSKKKFLIIDKIK